jgi:hypothetical protein
MNFLHACYVPCVSLIHCHVIASIMEGARLRTSGKSLTTEAEEVDLPSVTEIQAASGIVRFLPTHIAYWGGGGRQVI